MNGRRLSLRFGLRVWLAVALGALVLNCGDDATGPEPCEGTCLVVRNVSDLTVDDVRFSNCDDDSWGVNRLGTGRIAPNQSWEWEVAPGCWDIQATADMGDGTCSNGEYGTDISSGDRYVMRFEGCDPVPMP